MIRKQNRVDEKKKIPSEGHLTISIKDLDNNELYQFQIPSNTQMQTVNKIIWDHKFQYQKHPAKIIGFKTINQDILLDYKLAKGIGTLRNNLSIKLLYQNLTLQGLNKYKLQKCLATGGFSKVYLARSLLNGQFYAAKFVDKLKVPTDDKKVLIMNERRVNQSIEYPFLVKMHQFIETQNFYIFIMDYCPGGELFYLLRSIKRMSEQQARIYFVEILLGIEYLHKQGIMYRDLKPENIMIDETGHIKIADFGLAKFFREKSYSFCGSIQYMSPQIVTNLGHSFQVDYYCLGALLFQLLIGCPPFYDPQLTQHQTKMNIAYSQVQFPQDFSLSYQVKDLIQKLLVKNPNQRLGHFGGAKQIMLHPWIGKVNRNFIQSKNFDVPFTPNLGKFNFDPDEVGMSQERFTRKIQDQYRIINSRKNFKKQKQRKRSIDKNDIYRQKSMSPYSKNCSMIKKKGISRKSTQGSLTNILNNAKQYDQPHFKGLIYHELARFSTKKNHNKNKSPSFISISREKKQNMKKTLKIYDKTANKLYNIKTQIEDTKQRCNINENKLIKKKRLVTQQNQFWRQKSKENSRKDGLTKSMSKGFVKDLNKYLIRDVSNELRTSNDKISKKKQDNEMGVEKYEKSTKENALLKKSSKLKIKRFFNDKNQRVNEYGQNFRETCII